MTQDGSTPLLQEVMRRASARLVPLQAAIELTYGCNLRCKHCYIDQPVRKHTSDELSLEEWCDVLDQLVQMGTLSVYLTGGEILTRPDFFDIALEVKKRKFMLWLATNGVLIDADVAARLKELRPYWIAISLYGATAETHESVTGRAGSFARTVAAIRLLREQGLRVSAQGLLMDSNAQDGTALKELGESLGVDVTIGFQLAPTKGCAISPQQYEATYQALSTNASTSDYLLENYPRDSGPDICKAGKSICAVSPTGDVFPCLLMPLRVGNVREQSLEQIWHAQVSPELERLRALRKEDLTSCRNCDKALFCDRCMGVALGETGSLTGRPDSVCRYAAMRAQLYKERI